MRANKLKTILLGVAAFGLIATAAQAFVLVRTWKDGCGGGLTCLFDVCWCEADYDTPSNAACSTIVCGDIGCGQSMPQKLPRLPDNDLQVFRSWINNGAKND